jgi:hypothetical protein
VYKSADGSCGSPFALTKAIFCCLPPGSEAQAQEQNHQLCNRDGVVQMLEPADENKNNRQKGIIYEPNT